MNDPNPTPQQIAEIIVQADRCVKCGLCLPHCPTYTLTRHEAESPRGRIALAEALARGQLGMDEDLLAHLDSCLLCRRCEAVCPSGVAYGALMDGTRALTLGRHPRRVRLAADLLTHPRLCRLGVTASRCLPDAWVPGGQGLARAARALARRKTAVGTPPAPTDGPRVGLFLGCVGSVVQRSALQAAQRLLEAAGADVVTPSGQTCCGAMHAHLGDAARAARLAERNRRIFADAKVDAIVSLASGCGSQLNEQQPPLPVPHTDISGFLLDAGLIDRLRFRPLGGTALLHTPCTLGRQSGAAVAVRDLLGRIPQLAVVPLDTGYGCCGAAGLQLISHPSQGEALRKPLLDAIVGTPADYLITSNPGCALHLMAGIDGRGPKVLHPVELLSQQLDPSPSPMP